MKKLHLMIAALVFNVAPLAMAGTTPIIKLDKVTKNSFDFYVDSYNIYSFNNSFNNSFNSLFNLKATPKRRGIDAVRNTNHPFSFYAGAGVHKAFVGGYGAFKTHIPYHHYPTPPVTPVPEPETWALMLLGVGLLGYQVRRRKSKSAEWSAT